MKFATKLMHRLGMEHPILLAPMAGASTPALVAAVSEAGGLGSLGAAMMSPEAIRSAIREIRTRTPRKFNVNLFTYRVPEREVEKAAAMQARIAPYIRQLGGNPERLPALAPLPDMGEQIKTVLAERPDVFSFTFGMPDRETLSAFKQIGTFVIGTATTVAEAKMLSEAGVDAVVAQGSEAGGHRGTFAVTAEEGLVGTMALTPLIIDAVKIPVIAAGGIMDGRGIAAALMLGASAAALGTAFLVCPENDVVHPIYRQRLLEGDRSTTVSRAYTGRFARWIKNRFVTEMADQPAAIPSYPHQIPLTAPLRQLAAERREPELFPMLAGQGFPLCREMPAGELVARLVREMRERLETVQPAPV
jgi:nitronate monooxygenase